MPAHSGSKLAVVGAGSVGTSLAYAALIRGSASHVALYDVNAAKAEAEQAVRSRDARISALEAELKSARNEVGGLQRELAAQASAAATSAAAAAVAAGGACSRGLRKVGRAGERLDDEGGARLGDERHALVGGSKVVADGEVGEG